MLHHVALSLTGVVGPQYYRRLLSHFNTLEDVFTTPATELVNLKLITPKMAACFTDDLLKRAEKTIQWCRDYNIRLTTINDENYPSQLAEIYDPPYLLYSMGDLSLLQTKGIGIVGSRDNTLYGNNAIAELISGLVQSDVTIVSGLALGIDSAAHRATLDYGGKTIAVVANGLDTVYPAMNRELAATIIKSGGLIVTESAPGTDTRPFRFLQRNRIISGLTQGTIVVEAGLKSGALSTARHAISQGRDVLAVPGPINSPQSLGPNQLLLDGATPALSAEQVLTYIYGEGEKSTVKMTRTQAAPVAPKVSTPAVELSEKEELLVTKLSKESAKRMDELMESFDDSALLFELLLDLELKGVVEQLPGQTYRLV